MLSQQSSEANVTVYKRLIDGLHNMSFVAHVQERQAWIGDVSTIVIPFTTTFAPSSMLRRPSTFALSKSLLLLISHIPSLHSRPLGGGIELFRRDDGFPEEDPATAAFWWKFGVGLVLVLLGGVFAGMALFVGDAN